MTARLTFASLLVVFIDKLEELIQSQGGNGVPTKGFDVGTFQSRRKARESRDKFGYSAIVDRIVGLDSQVQSCSCQLRRTAEGVSVGVSENENVSPVAVFKSLDLLSRCRCCSSHPCVCCFKKLHANERIEKKGKKAKKKSRRDHSSDAKSTGRSSQHNGEKSTATANDEDNVPCSVSSSLPSSTINR